MIFFLSIIPVIRISINIYEPRRGVSFDDGLRNPPLGVSFEDGLRNPPFLDLELLFLSLVVASPVVPYSKILRKNEYEYSMIIMS